MRQRIQVAEWSETPKTTAPRVKFPKKLKILKFPQKIINKFPKSTNNTFSIKQLAKKYLQIINLDNF